jgi:hypothetical protein
MTDPGLSRSMPHVFGKPPQMVEGCLATDTAKVWRRWNPLFWFFIKLRGYLVLPKRSDRRD